MSTSSDVPVTLTPTQVIYPWRASIRTGIQTLLSVLPILVLASPIIAEFVEKFWPNSPVIAWVGGASVFAGALSVLITRLSAIPGVNTLLSKIGLGATPNAKS